VVEVVVVVASVMVTTSIAATAVEIREDIVMMESMDRLLGIPLPVSGLP